MTASKIEWTDRSDWNPIRGCTRVSPGCGGPGDHGGCYAEGMAARFSLSAAEVEAKWRADPKNAGKQPPTFKDQWGHGYAEMQGGKPRWTGKVQLQEDRLLRPLSWRKPEKVFASSTSDFFHESISDDERDQLLAVMALCPHLTFQVLTKRAERMREYLDDDDRIYAVGAALGNMLDGDWVWNEGKQYRKQIEGNIALAHGMTPDLKYFTREEFLPLPNVWLGVSAERQEEADARIPHLLQTPAAVRFISAEPLLGPIDLRNIRSAKYGTVFDALETETFVPNYSKGPALDWIIIGGESGPKARPMHPQWARDIRDQCADAGVAFFLKQWGAHQPTDVFGAGNSDVCVDGQWFARVGKKAAGRLLDGREHNEFPRVRA